MPRRQLGVLLIVASLLGALVLFVGARMLSGYVSDVHEGVATVAPGSYSAFDFVVYGAFTEIGYEFTVEFGPPIDIYFLTSSDFERYLSGLAPVDWNSWTFENVSSLDGSPYPTEETYRAVIDNSDFGIAKPAGITAVVRYHLSAGGVPGETASGYLLWAGTLVMVLLGLAATFVAGLVLALQKRAPMVLWQSDVNRQPADMEKK